MRHYDYLYPIPGKEQALEALLREWVQLYESENANSGWMVYQSFTGEDLPLYVIGTLAMDRGDYEADGSRLDELFGDVGWVDAFRLVEPGEHQYTWWSNRGRAWDNNTGWRIDYQVATPGVAATAHSARIYKDERFSDHAPLSLDYDFDIGPGGATA